MRDDADAYRQKVDLEQDMFHKLIDTIQTRSQETQKVKSRVD